MIVERGALGPETLLTREQNLYIFKELTKGEDKTPLEVSLWKYFLVLCETPRPSTNFKLPDVPERMDPVRKKLSTICTSLGASVRQDEAGNLLVTASGKGSGINKEPIALQGQ